MDDIIKLIEKIGFIMNFETEYYIQYYNEYNNWNYYINIKKTILQTRCKFEIIRIMDNTKLYSEYNSNITGINECLEDIKLLFRYVLRKKKIEELFK